MTDFGRADGYTGCKGPVRARSSKAPGTGCCRTTVAGVPAVATETRGWLAEPMADFHQTGTVSTLHRLDPATSRFSNRSSKRSPAAADRPRAAVPVRRVLAARHPPHHRGTAPRPLRGHGRGQPRACDRARPGLREAGVFRPAAACELHLERRAVGPGAVSAARRVTACAPSRTARDAPAGSPTATYWPTAAVT